MMTWIEDTCIYVFILALAIFNIYTGHVSVRTTLCINYRVQFVLFVHKTADRARSLHRIVKKRQTV